MNHPLITHASDDSFAQDVLNSEVPVLLDFWAEWCGPCRMVAPVLEEIAQEHAGALKVVKIDIDQNPQTPAKFGVRGIPTLMLFKKGQVEGQRVGAVSKATLNNFLSGKL